MHRRNSSPNRWIVKSGKLLAEHKQRRPQMDTQPQTSPCRAVENGAAVEEQSVSLLTVADATGADLAGPHTSTQDTVHTGQHRPHYHHSPHAVLCVTSNTNEQAEIVYSHPHTNVHHCGMNNDTQTDKSMKRSVILLVVFCTHKIVEIVRFTRCVRSDLRSLLTTLSDFHILPLASSYYLPVHCSSPHSYCCCRVEVTADCVLRHTV